jgi:hypothetical protein
MKNLFLTLLLVCSSTAMAEVSEASEEVSLTEGLEWTAAKEAAITAILNEYCEARK